MNETCGRIVGNWKCQFPAGHAGKHGTKVATVDLQAVIDAVDQTAPVEEQQAAIREALATKHCPRCDQTLPVASFSRRASAKDGLNPLCRTCRGLRRHDRRVARAAAKAAEEAK
jgi:Zn finger protein HypA/HybF involved in hydrogenase expression